MEQIFYVRGKGRKTKALTVFRDEQHYRLHFLILGRTNPTKAEKAAGAKEKRVIELDEEVLLPRDQDIIPSQYPLPDLVQELINFLNEGDKCGTDSD